MAEESIWRPACTPALLRLRAGMNKRIRNFFASRGVLEVETPLLGRRGVTDPALSAFTTLYRLPGQSGTETPLYLQTSPEFAMKRLLAAGCGSIYQICKAFRNEESGRHHNPEFTLLEWYRLGFSLDDLMGEVESLIGELFEPAARLLPPERITYTEVFRQYLDIHPVDDSLDSFACIAKTNGLPEASMLCRDERSVWLDLLFSHFIQPQLGRQRLTSVYDWPALMPSLARVRPEHEDYVERVEIFLFGMEIGNGFHELADADEQRFRFERDLQRRQALGLPSIPIDERLFDALHSGLPDCSGMAMGLDRLLMIMSGCRILDEVLAFPLDRA